MQISWVPDKFGAKCNIPDWRYIQNQERSQKIAEGGGLKGEVSTRWKKVGDLRGLAPAAMLFIHDR